jgi:integrin-linked kinase-associated serine/threonine phosphatase 2C
VIDILPPEKIAPSPPMRHGKIAFNNMFRRKSSGVPFKTDREYAEPNVVEEIFEDGSAMLSKR